MSRRFKLPSWMKGDGVLSVVWAFALAAALTWPVILDPSEAALGHVRADGMKHLWTLWWMQASVWQEGAFPFATQLINFPAGMELYPIEPLNGLVAVLLPFLDVVTLSNLLVLLNMTLTGVAGMWFGRELTGSRWGGLVAGTLIEGSSVMAFFVHVGVGELNHLWWLPLGLGVLLRARRTLDWKWFFALAACLVGALLSCFYLGFFLAVSVALVALTTLYAGRDTPRLLARYVLAAAISVGIVIPVLQSFSSSYKSGSVPDVGLSSYLFEDHGQPITDPPSARLEPAQLVTPFRKAARVEEQAYGGGRYLGALLGLLALAGLVRNPRKSLPLLVVVVFGLVFACGSYLTSGGELVLYNGARLRMPHVWLNRLLGYLAEPLNFPVRFLAMSIVGLGGMAALAIRRDRPLLRQLIVVPLAVLAVVEVNSAQMLDWPWARFAPRDSSVLAPLEKLEEGAVIDLALAVRADHENRWNGLSTQIVHGKRTQAVPIERIETFARDGYWYVRTLEFVQDLQPLYENKRAALNGDYTADFAMAREAGFRWVMVTYRTGNEFLPTLLVSELNRVCGEAVVKGRGIGVWELPEVDVEPEQIAEWHKAHMAKVDTLLQRSSAGAPGPQLK